MSSSSDSRAARPRGQVTGAEDPVLMSKITVPSPPAWAVRRPQIDKLITDGARGPLTTITGPAGSGKTMAMARVIELVQKPTLVLCHNKTLECHRLPPLLILSAKAKR